MNKLAEVKFYEIVLPGSEMRALSLQLGTSVPRHYVSIAGELLMFE